MWIQITAKEYNKLIRYGQLSTIINLGQLKQCYSYIKIQVIKQLICERVLQVKICQNNKQMYRENCLC